jgi:glycyl-tRNA synthetase alpha subunit
MKPLASYYKQTLPNLIEKLRIMVENSLEVIAKNIQSDTSEMELKAALESRKLAVEDVIWASKEIGRMEFEYGDTEEEKKDAFSEHSYFIKVIPRLIKELKGMVENNLEIVDKNIDSDLKDAKMKSALVSRRLAAEHAVWASKQVDELEKIISGKHKKEEKEDVPMQNWTKRMAQKAG